MTTPLAAAPAVTVVIATLDRRAWLAEAVESVRQQRGVRWELIVVNGTRDDTLQWLGGLGDPRIRGLQLPSPTERSTARNHGLAAVSSPLVMFLDDDDLLEDRIEDAVHLKVVKPEGRLTVAARQALEQLCAGRDILAQESVGERIPGIAEYQMRRVRDGARRRQGGVGHLV